VAPCLLRRVAIRHHCKHVVEQISTLQEGLRGEVPDGSPGELLEGADEGRLFFGVLELDIEFEEELVIGGRNGKAGEEVGACGTALGRPGRFCRGVRVRDACRGRDKYGRRVQQMCGCTRKRGRRKTPRNSTGSLCQAKEP
jgi:hypothetical protein